MIMIETSGDWREIGRQYAQQAGARLHEAMDCYAGWLKTDLAKHVSRIQELREQARQHCPELIDETAGMAEAAGVDELHMFGYRFFNELGPWASPPDRGCSCVFIADAAEGPLLGRNSDLEPGNSVSTCHVCRPDSGASLLTTTYLGMVAGTGFNEYGLGVASASAHGYTGNAGTERGLAAAILTRLVLGRCRSVSDAAALLAQHTFSGRGCIWIVGDATGAAARCELVPGQTPVLSHGTTAHGWLACTNFFVSQALISRQVIPDKIKDLDSAYARYGRMAHLLGERITPHTVSGLEQLLVDVAQPGLCQPETNTLRTAYSQVCQLETRVMHLTAGHPADAPFEPVSL